jgi:hypothetical protein
MSMEETQKEMERIKAAVLAECERVCPNYGDKHDLGGGIYLEATSHGWSLYETRSDRQCPKCFEPIWDYLTPENTTVQIFYCLLGLQSRDAVEAERAFWMECENERKADDLKLAAIYAESEVGRLQEIARAAALVEALERAKYACESGNQAIGCEKLPNGYGYKAIPDTAYEAICNALAARKEGVVQND